MQREQLALRLNSWTEGRQESLYFILNSKGNRYQVLNNENRIARFFVCLFQNQFMGVGRYIGLKDKQSDRPLQEAVAIIIETLTIISYTYNCSSSIPNQLVFLMSQSLFLFSLSVLFPLFHLHSILPYIINLCLTFFSQLLFFHHFPPLQFGAQS